MSILIKDRDGGETEVTNGGKYVFRIKWDGIGAAEGQDYNASMREIGSENERLLRLPSFNLSNSVNSALPPAVVSDGVEPDPQDPGAAIGPNIDIFVGYGLVAGGYEKGTIMRIREGQLEQKVQPGGHFPSAVHSLHALLGLQPEQKVSAGGKRKKRKYRKRKTRKSKKHKKRKKRKRKTKKKRRKHNKK